MSQPRKYELSQADIRQLVLNEISRLEGREVTEVEFQLYNDERKGLMALDKELYPEMPPSCYGDNFDENLALIEWAIEQKEMLEILYEKPNRERSVRIITPLYSEGLALHAMLHVTMRGTELEYTNQEDYMRKFIHTRILSVRLNRF